MKDGIVAVDLFCGAGGLTRGLLDAGITVKKGYDIETDLKDTYEKNNNGTTYYCEDVKNLTKDDILDGLDTENNYFLLAGCAPCQPFSLINRNPKNDERSSLLLEFGRLIAETLPDFVFLENVPGLKNGNGSHIFKKFIKILDNNGYNYKSEVLDAKEYGVPQKRKRLILLASKHSDIKLPEPTHGPNSLENKPYVTVRDTISRYPPIRTGKWCSVPNHTSSALSEKNKLRLVNTPKDGGSRSDLPKDLRLKCHSGHKGHTDVYGRMKWDDVSPTLTSKCTSISNGRFAHPSQTRGISVREAAALQTFRDDYVFYGPVTITTRWVGNAVPVKLAEIFGNYFMKLISE